MYRRSGKVIGDMVRSDIISEDQLWKLCDAEFWATLRARASPEELEELDHLERGPPDENGLPLPRGAKIRTIDPDVVLPGSELAQPLSQVCPEWKNERLAYIAQREAQRSD
jgi:hypothetical protein